MTVPTTSSVDQSVSTPDSTGHFGEFGGRFVPEALVAALDELTDAFHSAQTTTSSVSSTASSATTPAGRRR